MSADHPQNMDELYTWIEDHRRQLFEVVDGQPDSALVERTDAAGWSAKDHLIHLAMWERSIDYLLQSRPRHEGLGVSQDVYLGHDVDRINEVIFQQHRDKDLATVRREFDDVHGDFLSTLGGLTWDELFKTYSHYAPAEPGEDRGDPVAFWVAGNTYGHYDQHREWIAALLEGR